MKKENTSYLTNSQTNTLYILITGCCGFIGTNLCLKLLKENKNIIIYGIDNIINNYNINFKYENLKKLQKYSNFIFNKTNISNYNINNNINIVIHLASIPGVRRSLSEPILYLDNNVKEYIILLEKCKKLNIKNIIFASSSSVYGNNISIPFKEDDILNNIISPYALSKKCMEIYSKYYSDQYNMNIIGLRFFTVYGPMGRPDMAPYIFIKNISENKPINKYGNGDSLRDYTYIDDIINGIVLCINKLNNMSESNYIIYNLGSNNPIKLNKFIELIEKIVNKKAIINKMSNQMGDVKKTYADISKAKEELGFKINNSIETGLNKTYLWMKKNNRILLNK